MDQQVLQVTGQASSAVLTPSVFLALHRLSLRATYAQVLEGFVP